MDKKVHELLNDQINKEFYFNDQSTKLNKISNKEYNAWVFIKYYITFIGFTQVLRQK